MINPAMISMSSNGIQIMRRIRFLAASHLPNVMYGTKIMAVGTPYRRPPAMDHKTQLNKL